MTLTKIHKSAIVVGAIAILVYLSLSNSGIQTDVPQPPPNVENFDPSKFKIILNCTLPDVPKTLRSLKGHNIPISKQNFTEIASEVFNFTNLGDVTEVYPGGLELRQDNRVFSMYDMSYLFYSEPYEFKIVEWSEEENKRIADEFLEKLFSHWKVPTEAKIKFRMIDGLIRSYTINETDIHTNTPQYVIYSEIVNGYPLLGADGQLEVAIAEGRVVDLRLVILPITSDVEIPIMSPKEALLKYFPGAKWPDSVGVSSYAIMPKSGDIIVNKVELGYSTGHDVPGPSEFEVLPAYATDFILRGYSDGQLITAGINPVISAIS